MRDLFFGQGTGHSIMLLAFVIAAGIYLGKFKVKGVSLGTTWILFVGIVLIFPLFYLCKCKKERLIHKEMKGVKHKYNAIEQNVDNQKFANESFL